MDPGTVDGVLANADTDGIDEMVLFPSFGLCVPTLEDPVLAPAWPACTTGGRSSFCAEGDGRLHAAAVVPIEHGEAAVTVMDEAKDLGLVATIVPPALKTRTSITPTSTVSTLPRRRSTCRSGSTGTRIHLPKIGVDRFDNYIQVHCVSFPSTRCSP